MAAGRNTLLRVYGSPSALLLLSPAQSSPIQLVDMTLASGASGGSLRALERHLISVHLMSSLPILSIPAYREAATSTRLRSSHFLSTPFLHPIPPFFHQLALVLLCTAAFFPQLVSPLSFRFAPDHPSARTDRFFGVSACRDICTSSIHSTCPSPSHR